MKKTLSLAWTTYREAARQPLYYILIVVFGLLILLSHMFTLFTFGEGEKRNMIREMGISSILLCGLFLAIVVAYQVITRELESRTALTLLSKPLSRTSFLIGKFLGMMWAIFYAVLALFFGFVVALWWGEGEEHLRNTTDITQWKRVPTHARIAYATDEQGHRIQDRDEQGTRHDRWKYETEPDEEGLGRVLFEPYVALLGNEKVVVPRGSVPHKEQSSGQMALRAYGDFGRDVWEMAKATFLTLLAVAILGALAIVLAPHLSLVLNGAVCLSVFVLGNLAIYIYQLSQQAGVGWRIFARCFRALVPDLSLFNLSLYFSPDQKVELNYLATVSAYGIIYAIVVLAIGAYVFNRREIA